MGDAGVAESRPRPSPFLGDAADLPSRPRAATRRLGHLHAVDRANDADMTEAVEAVAEKPHAPWRRVGWVLA